MGTSINSFFGRIAALRGGLLGSDANFMTMQSIAPEGRAKGTMNLDSDPKNPFSSPKGFHHEQPRPDPATH